MLECIQQIDRSFLVWVQSFGTPFLDRFWLIITEKENSLPLYLVMLFLAQRYLGWKRFGILVLFTVLLITVSDQCTNAFKNGFMRLRPCHDPDVTPLLRLRGHVQFLFGSRFKWVCCGHLLCAHLYEVSQGVSMVVLLGFSSSL
jgi:undecaprenyl-diphosphatase